MQIADHPHGQLRRRLPCPRDQRVALRLVSELWTAPQKQIDGRPIGRAIEAIGRDVLS